MPPRTLCSDSTSSYTHTFDNVVAGTYTFKLTAINGNSPSITTVSGTAATSGDVIVGLPGQPRLQSAVGSVGKATIAWQKPLFDPADGAGAGRESVMGHVCR